MKNAFFAFREDNYLADIPDVFLPQFLEQNFVSGVALCALKHNIRRRFGGDQTMSYSVKVKPAEIGVAGVSKLPFDGLDAFGERVFVFMQNAIDRQYPYSMQEVAFLHLSYPTLPYTQLS